MATLEGHELTNQPDGSITCSCGKAWRPESDPVRRARRAAWVTRHLNAARRRLAEDILAGRDSLPPD